MKNFNYNYSTFSKSIFTSASLRCFFVWNGFLSKASKFGSPDPKHQLLKNNIIYLIMCSMSMVTIKYF